MRVVVVIALIVTIALASLVERTAAECSPNCAYGNTAGCCFDPSIDKANCMSTFTHTCMPNAIQPASRCACVSSLFTCLRTVYPANCVCPSASCTSGVNTPILRLAPDVVNALQSCPAPCVYTATPAPSPGTTPAIGATSSTTTTSTSPAPGMTPAAVTSGSPWLDGGMVWPAATLVTALLSVFV